MFFVFFFFIFFIYYYYIFLFCGQIDKLHTKKCYLCKNNNKFKQDRYEKNIYNDRHRCYYWHSVYSCEKSDTYNVSQNNIKQRIQKEGENTRLYQLQWCYTEDGVNGYSCTGPVAVVATLQCSTPHGCVPFSSPQDQPPTTITMNRLRLCMCKY